jgi:DNA-binding transcriptional regulator YhcF (GntR family)
MEFRESQPIYLQIADYVCEKILLHEWNPGDRVPSVRELAIQLEVNPNTVMRTYDFLQSSEILVNERGVGLFVSTKALKNSLAYMQDEFTQKVLPHVLRKLVLLRMDIDSLKPYYDKYVRRNFPSLKQTSNEA